MSSIEKVSIALSSELLRTVKAAVSGGDYASTSEVVREALREWKLRRPTAAEPASTSKPGAPLLPLSPEHLAAIRQLCRQFGVRHLAVFGSALGPDFSTANDVDVAVEFGPATVLSLVDQYFGFKSALEALFARPVDLVELSAMPDSRLKRHIQRTARDIDVDYAAA